MIPDDVSFHDAVIADIENEGKDLVLTVEDVVVDDGEEIVSGVLTFEDVESVSLDGETVPALEMAGEDGEIQELEVLGSVVKLSVIWTDPDTSEETENLYVIECGNIRWAASD